jgi:hypothetical protein
MIRRTFASLVLLVAFLATSAFSAAPAATNPAATPPPPGDGNQIGPDSYPAGVNPLTGLKVENPNNLLVPPALISISNFPKTTRPQAGLSYSPLVFELFIGDGETRFLAMFYGDYPQEALKSGEPAGSPDTTVDDSSIGPIRSGRLPYESLRKQFNGFLIMASAYKSVASQLSSFTNIFGSDGGDINSAMINVTKLEEIAKATKKELGASDLSGMSFDQNAPEGGVPGQVVKIPYAMLNQVEWHYNDADGSYHRVQDNADGATFTEYTDRLTGDPLTMENVVILFATHHAWAPTLIDVDLNYITPSPALLFRDGKMYKIRWTTASDDYERKTGKLRPIRFIDDKGQPFPMKPGQTWVHIVPSFTNYYETVDSQKLFDILNKKEAGSGNWVIRFFPPEVEERPKTK